MINYSNRLGITIAVNRSKILVRSDDFIITIIYSNLRVFTCIYEHLRVF